MGGPCFLVDENTENWGENPKKQKGPTATDNFQVKPFEFDGKLWQSVEQCYQAMKFVDEEHQEKIRRETKSPSENDWDHGMRCWKLGQRTITRPQWLALKVEYMYRINVAKYLAHPDLQQELLATGDALIIGGPSTADWRMWNGLIQTRIRKELKGGVLGKETLSGKELEAALKEPFAAWVAADSPIRSSLAEEQIASGKRESERLGALSSFDMPQIRTDLGSRRRKYLE